MLAAASGVDASSSQVQDPRGARHRQARFSLKVMERSLILFPLDSRSLSGVLTRHPGTQLLATLPHLRTQTQHPFPPIAFQK